MKPMKIGTKSVLFGAHQFLIHPWFVAWAWWKLYGFPFDPRLWVAFFVHDLGYWGKPNMDGPEGERHVEFGADIMGLLFDWGEWHYEKWPNPKSDEEIEKYVKRMEDEDWECLLAIRTGFFVRKVVYKDRWQDLCRYHSRFYAKRDGKAFSRLCVADKLAIVLTPAWLYLPMVRATGEIHEYMALAKTRTAAGEPKYASMQVCGDDQRQWYADVQEYVRRWVDEHRDGRDDTWTPDTRSAISDSGVWK